jgi:hypothetical protein
LPDELGRLGSYRDAVRAGFYHEGWGTLGPDRPVQVHVMFARPLPAERVAAWRGRLRARLAARDADLEAELHRLGITRLLVYLQDTPAGALALVASELLAFASPVSSTLNSDLLAVLDLVPGAPGPAGSAALVCEWVASAVE